MKILFFAQLKDATGCAQVVWAETGGMGSAELWDRLLREFPGLAVHRASVRLARNGAYAGADERFEMTDEVALIPPVSGG